MNREIKFRVWDDQYNRMLNWDEICNSKFNIIADENVEMSLLEFLLKYQPNKNMIIQQFTGLKDKNEKEIYEGDIVKEIYSVGIEGSGRPDVVKWAKFDHFISGWYCDLIPLYGKNVEIVGNIYENPELIEK